MRNKKTVGFSYRFYFFEENHASAFLLKAPSGRELAPKVTEGACGILFFRLLYCMRFWSVAHSPPPDFVEPPLGGSLFANPVIKQIGRENNSSAEIGCRGDS